MKALTIQIDFSFPELYFELIFYLLIIIAENCDLIGRKECNLIITFQVTREKQTLTSKRKFNASIAFAALFAIRFRSLFFDVEKRTQHSEVNQQLEIFHRNYLRGIFLGVKGISVSLSSVNVSNFNILVAWKRPMHI